MSRRSPSPSLSSGCHQDALSVLFVTKGRFLKHRFENIASSLSERQVTVAGDFQLYFDPINVKFVADGLSVSNPGWASRRKETYRLRCNMPRVAC